MHIACADKLLASAYRNMCPMCRTPVGETTELEEYRRVLKWAEKGRGWAMLMIAQHYRYGRGVKKSLRTARLWYSRAAEQGIAAAQYNLALMHDRGLGGPESMEQALVWYKRAAKQGIAAAQYNLALMHSVGLV